MTDYSGLIERIEVESGEDRKIDGKLALIEVRSISDDERSRRATLAVEALERGESYPTGVPHYTGSLDAALAFAVAMDMPWHLTLTRALKRCPVRSHLPRLVISETLSAIRALSGDTTDAE